jgi:hypothetical protein
MTITFSQERKNCHLLEEWITDKQILTIKTANLHFTTINNIKINHFKMRQKV